MTHQHSRCERHGGRIVKLFFWWDGNPPYGVEARSKEQCCACQGRDCIPIPGAEYTLMDVREEVGR